MSQSSPQQERQQQQQQPHALNDISRNDNDINNERNSINHSSSSYNYVKTPATSGQLMIAFMVLGTSAGMVLYTKRTDSMLRTLNQASTIHAATAHTSRNLPPVITASMIGPPTFIEWKQMNEYLQKQKAKKEKEDDDFY